MRFILNFLAKHLVGLFFISILGASLAVLVVFLSSEENLYGESSKRHHNIASLEINNFSLLRITNGKTDLVIQGKGVIRLPDSEIFEDIKASRIIGPHDSIEKINSKVAIKHHNEITFPDGITYSRDSVSFNSSKGTLDMDKNIFTGKGEFTLSNDDSKLSGSNLLYDIKQRTIKGDYIKAIVQ